MNNVKASELIDAVLEEADMVGSEFVSRKTVLRFLNSELRELHDILVCSYEAYMVKTDERTLSAGEVNIQLPDDFFKLWAIIFSSSNGTQVVLNRFFANELSSVTGPESSISDAYGTNLSYMIIDNRITLLPPPSGGENINMLYIPQFTKLESEDDSVHIRIPVGWEDFVIPGAVARCLLKEESDPSGAFMLKDRARQHIIDMAEERDESRNFRITDKYNWIDRNYGGDF